MPYLQVPIGALGEMLMMQSLALQPLDPVRITTRRTDPTVSAGHQNLAVCCPRSDASLNTRINCAYQKSPTWRSRTSEGVGDSSTSTVRSWRHSTSPTLLAAPHVFSPSVGTTAGHSWNGRNRSRSRCADRPRASA